VRTERIVLRIGKADGSSIEEVPMRYNASHQRGYRCFIGPLADAPEQIMEDTARSFEGRSLFDALAVYRRAVEPEDWPKPDQASPMVQRLFLGEEQTESVNGFEAAPFTEVGSLEEQRLAFEAWKASLVPVHMSRVPPKAGHEHDPAGVEFSDLSRLAGRILSQRDD
jgi:hypothetical protein